MALIIVSEDVLGNHSGEPGVFNVEGELFGTYVPLGLIEDEVREKLGDAVAAVTCVTNLHLIYVQVLTSRNMVKALASGLQEHLNQRFHPRHTGRLLRPEEALSRAAEREEIEDFYG